MRTELDVASYRLTVDSDQGLEIEGPCLLAFVRAIKTLHRWCGASLSAAPVPGAGA